MKKVCAQLKTFGKASVSCFYAGQFTFSMKIFLFLKSLCIYDFWQSWGFVQALSSCGAQASRCGGFSWCWGLTLGSAGFSGCDLWAQQLCFLDSGAEAQELWLTPASRSQHVGCSWTGDWTHVSCTGRWILIHWTTRETPIKIFLFHTSLSHGSLKGEHELCRNFIFGLKNSALPKFYFGLKNCMVDGFCLIEFSNFSPSSLHRH